MRILNLDPDDYSREAKEILQSIGSYEEKKISRKELIDQISLYEIVILRFSHSLDSEVLSKAIRLKYIGCNATGIDHIDENYANQIGAKVISLKNEKSYLNEITASSEHTWGLILALVRNIPSAVMDVRSGNWERNNFVGKQLYKKKIGIYGLGRNGLKVAKFANAFEMEVLAHETLPPDEIPTYIRLVSADELLKNSDVLSIHLPLNSSTSKIINRETISIMKNGGFLVNTSRGGLIDEEALINALISQKLAGVALDVIEHENDIGNSRLKLLNKISKDYNLLITPHIGGATVDSWESTELFIANKLKKYFKKNND